MLLNWKLTARLLAVCSVLLLKVMYCVLSVASPVPGQPDPSCCAEEDKTAAI